MQRIYSMRSPKTHTSPWAVLPAIAMAAMITTGSLATMVLSEKTIDRDTVVNTSSDVTTTDKASMKISDVVLRVTNALANGDITSTQAAQCILAAQQNLQAAEAFAAYKQEVIEAYKAGDIERTDIRPKLAAFKKQLGATMVNQLKERMNAAVKNGVMTKEDVLQIWSMHKTMSEQASKVLTRADYAQAQAKMQAMVEAGKLTQAQMTEKLSAMRKMIGRGRGQARGGGERANGGDGRGVSDECMTLRRRLGAAVSNGDMTREEAGEVWRAEGCGN